MLNAIVATVSIILQLKGSAVIGSATGFFYTSGERLFLVTNRHVVMPDPPVVAPEALRLRLHTTAADIAKNDEVVVPLYENGKPVWRTQPSQAAADIAVILLNKDQLQKQFFFRAWSKENFLPPSYKLDPGEDVFIMGYPLAFHDQSNNLPIFRNAMIASSYGVGFQSLPLFLTDANLHPGTSGSPVITKPKSAWVDDKGNTNLVTGTVYYILGVHSGTIDPKVTGGKDIGLGAAWYISLVEEIAAGFPK
jgi:S1-C subfamily serine protease